MKKMLFIILVFTPFITACDRQQSCSTVRCKQCVKSCNTSGKQFSMSDCKCICRFVTEYVGEPKDIEKLRAKTCFNEDI